MSTSNLVFHESFGFSIDDGPYIWTPNRVVNQGLNYILNAGLNGGSAISAWYIAPFAANVTPAADVTAASFAATLTEFTSYSESNRQLWTPDAAATAMELINDAAPALFTVTGGGQTSIYGAGLLSAQAKGATTGTCFSAGRLQGGAALTGLQDGFEVRIKYRVTGSSS